MALICHHCCRLMSFLLRVTAFLLTASCCQIPFTSKLWGESCFFSFSGLLVIIFKKTERNSAAFLGAQNLLSQHSSLWSPSDDAARHTKIKLKISSKKSAGLHSFWYGKSHLPGQSKKLVELSDPTDKTCAWILMAPKMNYLCH